MRGQYGYRSDPGNSCKHLIWAGFAVVLGLILLGAFEVLAAMTLLPTLLIRHRPFDW